MHLKVVPLYGNAGAYHAPEDIYETREECLADHPKNFVMTGYGVKNVETGEILPAPDGDWFQYEEDAATHLEHLTK